MSAQENPVERAAFARGLAKGRVLDCRGRGERDAEKLRAIAMLQATAEILALPSGAAGTHSGGPDQ
jgi:hypothetical protein